MPQPHASANPAQHTQAPEPLPGAGQGGYPAGAGPGEPQAPRATPMVNFRNLELCRRQPPCPFGDWCQQGEDYGINRQAKTNTKLYKGAAESGINPTGWTPKETSQGITREKGTKKCLAQKKEPKTPAPTVIRLQVGPGGIGLAALRAA